MDRFIFDADFRLLDGCKYRISGISQETTINGITLTKVKSSARLMASPVDESAEDLHTVLRKLAHFAAENLVSDPNFVFDLNELPSIIENLRGTETEIACEVSIRLMPTPQSGGGSRETRLQQNASFLTSLICPIAKQVKEKRKSQGDSEDKVSTRKSSRDTEKDPKGAVQQTLVCEKCSYRTYLAGPIAVAKELKEHLENSSACRRTQEGVADVDLAPTTRRREEARSTRVKKANEEDSGTLITCCDTCPWAEVRNYKNRNPQQVLSAHRKDCAFFKTRDVQPGQDGDFLSDDETGPQLITVEQHDNFLVNVIQAASGKTTTEKALHRQKMKHLDDQFADFGVGGEDSRAVVVEGPVAEVDGEDSLEGQHLQKSRRQDASPHVLYHQRKLESALMDPLPDMRDGKDPQATIALYDLGMTLSLSRREGDLLLDYLQKHTTGPVYKRWEGIQTAFDKQFKELSVLHRLEIELPVEFFGETELGGRPLKKVACEYYDILLRLGDAFLEIRPDDFSQTCIPDIVEKTRERIYNTFPNAELFQRFCVWTSGTHGADAVPIVIAIYYDKAQATASRSFCPLIMFILNCTGESFKPIFLGYCPILLPYSDEVLTKMLHNRSRTGRAPSKKSCKYAIRFAKRRSLQRFLVHVLKPIVDCKTGILLQLGARRMYPEEIPPVVIFGIPYVSHSMGDSEALHDLGSVSLLSKSCRCRSCYCSNLNAFGREHQFDVRNSSEMYALASRLGEYEVYKFQRRCGLIAHQRLSIEERARRKEIRQMGKYRGVIPGENPVILLWDELEKAKIIPFYESLTIDILHTIWKGILEMAVSSVLMLIHCISLHWADLGLDHSFRESLANLDQRISLFPGGKESLQPVPFVQLDNVSDLLKTESKKAKAQSRTTGIMTGSFPAWQMRNLCLQLVFGIGWKGKIVPNEEVSFTTPSGQEWLEGNPTSLCLNALISVLEVAAYCQATELTESQVIEMSKYIDSAACRLLQLYNFKHKLCLHVGYIQRSAKTAVPQHEMPRNFKTHAMVHLPRQFRLFGEWRAYDAAFGEKYHQVAVSGAVKRSSGVLETTQQEMAVHVVRKQLARMQSENLPSNASKVGNDEKEDVFETDSRYQSFHGVPSLGSITLLPSSDDNMLYAKDDEVIDYLHPLLEPRELYALISHAASGDSIVRRVFQGVMREENPDFAIRLFGAVKSDGDTKAGVEPWYLRADRRYQGNSRGKHTRGGIPVFNSFEIEYDDGEPGENYFVKVFALVGFQESKVVARKRAVIRTDYWVAIARYVKVPKPRHAPFAQYSLEHERGRLSIDLVPISSVKRPCFMCVSSDAPSNQRVENKYNYMVMVWSCIPFSTAVKVQNVAIADTYDKVSEHSDSAFASDGVIAEVLSEFGLQGHHNHALTARQLRMLHRPANRRAGTDSENSSSESDDDDSDEDGSDRGAGDSGAGDSDG